MLDKYLGYEIEMNVEPDAGRRGSAGTAKTACVSRVPVLLTLRYDWGAIPHFLNPKEMMTSPVGSQVPFWVSVPKRLRFFDVERRNISREGKLGRTRAVATNIRSGLGMRPRL